MDDSSSSDENINETDSSTGNEPEYTEHEMNSLVYSNGSETSEEDEKDSIRLEIIHKICLQTNIVQLINYLYLHCIVFELYSNSIVFKYNKGRKN